MMSLQNTLYWLVAFTLTAMLIPIVRRLALRSGFVDQPGGRKQHEGAIPPIGGVVVFPVFMAMSFFHGVPRETLWLFGGVVLLLLTGALDDAFVVPPHIKFAVQWLAALIIVMPGAAKAHDLGNLLGFGQLIWGQAGTIIFSVVATVLLINAINLMDGLDGLAGGVGAIALLLLCVCAVLRHAETLWPPALLIACLAGFLLYNLRRPGRARASIFLGDSGSLALGLSLAWFAIHLSQGPAAILHPIGVAWLLALPIFDICGQFARRVAQGRHPFDADHNHFHHHFINAGLSPGRATASILALSFLLGLIGVGGIWLGVPDALLAYTWIALLLSHIYLSMRPSRYRRLLTKLRAS